MCNCKGWDVVYYSDHVSLEPHWCRTYGDCGSEDRTIKQAAQEVAEWYEEQARLWREGTHPDIQYYKEPEEFE